MNYSLIALQNIGHSRRMDELLSHSMQNIGHYREVDEDK